MQLSYFRLPYGLFFVFFCLMSLSAQAELKYQLPSDVLVKLVDAPPTPSIVLSPTHAPGPRRILIQQISSLLTISDLSQTEIRLAGLRFNPKARAPSRVRYVSSLKLGTLPSESEPSVETKVTGFPATPHLLYARWSPDAKHIAVVNADSTQTREGLSLWIVDVASAKASQIPALRLNAVLSNPFEWINNDSIAALSTPKTLGPAPIRSLVPTGPVVQENEGRTTPGPTFEDLLKSPTDEKIFTYYSTSQLVEVKLKGGVRNLGKPGIFAETSASPDGKYLLIDELHTPFSYAQPYTRFPVRREVLTFSTGALKVIDDAPLIDNLPIDRDAVEPGPRAFSWRTDLPATLTYVQAADGGDAKREAKVRDRIYELDAPFTDNAKPIADLSLRYRDIDWGNEHLAIVSEGRWKDRKIIISTLDPSTGKLVQLYQGSTQDKYNDPGTPVLERNVQGKLVLHTTADHQGVYFTAHGESPKGDMPFIAIIPINAGANPTEKRIWQSQAPFLENPTAILESENGVRVLARRESVEKSPNYFLTTLAKDLPKVGEDAPRTWLEVTRFPNPYAGLPMPSHQQLRYKRADGIDLTADLYLPANYDKSKGPLPTLMEAYPTEFKSKEAAGQVRGSPYEFTRIYPGSPVSFTASGYAVLANASIPIIGEGKSEPNDTYVDQLSASAEAAIKAGADTGGVDPKRVGVTGHSYGAFMTANLLAHTSLFRAGMAESGAYNRTLTPFGFQSEERTYWQAPEIYYKMSPFSFADKIKTPILLIHGEADNNPGTFTIQSERFYNALKGAGAVARFVLLPLEAHGYQGRESVLHTLWEEESWLDKYVKPVLPAKSTL